MIRFGELGWRVRVLAIGATGQFAGLVVPALVSRGIQLRALVHDPANQDQVRDAGADQAVVGDLRDPVGMRAALDEVDGVFLIIPAFAPDSAALDTAVVAAGVWRLVFSGVYLALRTILGRTPRSLNDFFAEFAR